MWGWRDGRERMGRRDDLLVCGQSGTERDVGFKRGLVYISPKAHSNFLIGISVYNIFIFWITFEIA